MITISIIGILAVIALPKFADMVRKSKEGATKGNLGALRSTLSIYYSDLEGLYPATIVANDALTALTINGKFLTAIPVVRAADYHGDNAAELDGATGHIPPDDAGSWYYLGDID